MSLHLAIKQIRSTTAYHFLVVVLFALVYQQQCVQQSCLKTLLVQQAEKNRTTLHTHTQTFYCWSVICPGPPGSAGTRNVKPIWIYWSNRQWVAVASAGPYADLHLAPDRQPCQARCPSCRPTNSVKALFTESIKKLQHSLMVYQASYYITESIFLFNP